MAIKRIMMEIRGTVASNRGRGKWYTPHMAAASRAIAERIPLLDFVLEVRDARIPLSSEYQLLRNCPSSFRHIVVLNKADLAPPSKLKEWINHFEQRNCISYGVNSHNKDNVKQVALKFFTCTHTQYAKKTLFFSPSSFSLLLLNFLQAQVREFKKIDHHGSTITVMIVGIPNVGKSALANSLHQIGRISAAEKGKLKNAAVSPLPGETKDITSLKIASHPNIYVLDTPGILPPQILDLDVYSKLALTGAITDCYVGEKALAEYFLSILNLSDQYKKWGKLSASGNDKSSMDQKIEFSTCSDLDMKEKKRYSTDHTQDVTLHSVRQSLFDTISCFNGNVQNEKDLEKLIEVELKALQEVFLVSSESGDGGLTRTASKLLNLYRTGRLGRYTLDHITKKIKK